MGEIEERRLPGVGVCYEFVTHEGFRLGVVTHKSGRRDVLAYERDDPDRGHELFSIDQDEARTLAELLGGTSVTERISEFFQTSLGGVTIEWVEVDEGWSIAGRPMGEAQLRSRTGVSLVAIIRDEEAIPSPRPDVVIEAGDRLVLIGTPEAVETGTAILERGAAT